MLAGCAVGPDFHSPPPPPTNRYTIKPMPAKTVSSPGEGGKSQHFTSTEDIPLQWWALFHSPSLNALICQGLVQSPTVAAAQAALRQAQENWRAEVGALFPAISLGVTGSRQRQSGAQFSGQGGTPSTVFNLYNTSVSATYLLDVWGGTRRQIEALAAQADFEFFQWQATYLTLTSNIATTAITQASLREQILATNELIKAEQHELDILQKQFVLGGVSRVDVLTQQTQVENTRATLPPLEKNLSELNNAMAVLVGELPSESHLPVFHLQDLHLPTRLPVSIPSSLVRRRPDIQASEALLHEASAKIGVATANMFPQITLTANAGWTSITIGTLFQGTSSIWQYGGQLLQPIFQGGMLLSERRAAIAAYQQAAAQYRQTVLQAFQSVADALKALEFDARALRAETNAENAAYADLQLTREQFKLGAVNYLFLLNAQFQYLQTRINRIKAEAARYNDTVALFQALGGGLITPGIE